MRKTQKETAVRIGDLLLHDGAIDGRPGRRTAEAPRLALVKALSVIALSMHDLFSRQDFVARPDTSRHSCILSSLAARDFLRQAGYEDAAVAPVCVLMEARRSGRTLHSLSIGEPGAESSPFSWNGHLVTVLPRVGLLLDTTLYQAIRPAWDGLPGMMAVNAGRKSRKRISGLRAIGGASFTVEEDAYRFDMLWLSNPVNVEWQSAPDADPVRRRSVVEAMLDIYAGADPRLARDRDDSPPLQPD